MVSEGKVRIGKEVNYKTLETALVKAAKKVGWKAKIKDNFKKNYKLGSVQEIEEYSNTTITLRGKVFPTIIMYFMNKNPSDYFTFFQYPIFGIASQRKIKKYLNAVSENL